MSRPYHKMSEREYIDAIHVLRERAARDAARGNPIDEASLAEQEHELTITYALGPAVRESTRKEMRRINQSLASRRNLLIREFTEGRLAPAQYARQLNELMRDIAQEYSRILSPSQLEAFLGVSSPTE